MIINAPKVTPFMVTTEFLIEEEIVREDSFWKLCVNLAEVELGVPRILADR